MCLQLREVAGTKILTEILAKITPKKFTKAWSIRTTNPAMIYCICVIFEVQKKCNVCSRYKKGNHFDKKLVY